MKHLQITDFQRLGISANANYHTYGLEMKDSLQIVLAEKQSSKLNLTVFNGGSILTEMWCCLVYKI